MKFLPLLTTLAIGLITSPFASAEESPSLIGEWSGSPASRPDKLVILTFEEGGKGFVASKGVKTPITYTEDRTQTPHHLDILATKPGMDEPQQLLSLFEFVNEDTVRITQPEPNRAEAFNDRNVLLAKRAAATPETVSSQLMGKWMGLMPGESPKPIYMEFTADGKAVLQEGGRPKEEFTFGLSGDASPYRLSLTKEGKSMLTIFAFEGKDQVRIDEPSKSAGTEFSDSAILFDRVPEVEVDVVKAIIGDWQMAGGNPVKMTFKADGTATVVEGEKEPEQLTYVIAKEGELSIVTMTGEGKTRHAAVTFAGEDHMQITKPSEQKPEGLDRAAIFERSKP